MTARNLVAPPSPSPWPHALKRWTVEDYHRMDELGLLPAAERTELIEGQILVMAAKGTPHVLALRLARDRFEYLLSEQPVLVSTQDPIQLDDFSEPEPDLAVIRGDILDYAENHPRSQDVVLVVEVADSTLAYDLETKDKLYAESGILDYWVIDLKNRCLHIFREPSALGYGLHLTLSELDQASPLAFSELIIHIADLLPPT